MPANPVPWALILAAGAACAQHDGAELLAENDDANCPADTCSVPDPGCDAEQSSGSEIVWTAPTTASHAVIVHGYRDRGYSGTYTVGVAVVDGPPPAPPAPPVLPPPAPPPVDCLGDWSPCTAACEPAAADAAFCDRSWIETRAPVGDGAACENQACPPCIPVRETLSHRPSPLLLPSGTGSPTGR